MKPKHMRSGICMNEYQSLPSRRNPETFPAGAMAKREKGKAFLSLSLSLSLLPSPPLHFPLETQILVLSNKKKKRERKKTKIPNKENKQSQEQESESHWVNWGRVGNSGPLQLGNVRTCVPTKVNNKTKQKQSLWDFVKKKIRIL